MKGLIRSDSSFIEPHWGLEHRLSGVAKGERLQLAPWLKIKAHRGTKITDNIELYSILFWLDLDVQK